MTSAVARDHRHADRRGIPPWLMASLTIAVAAAAGIAGQSMARGRLTPQMGFAAGFGVATLAMVGLPSVSVRFVSRMFVLLSAVVLVRFGATSGTLASGGQALLAWVVAGITAMVLADRVGAEVDAPLAGDAPTGGTASPARTARTAAIVAAMVLLVAIVLAPILLPHVGTPTSPGRGANLNPFQGSASSLRASSSLDMTSRPELTDEVVFTVETDRATFWRGQTFDVWDGRSWTRSDDSFAPVVGETPVIGADDLGARGSDVVEQRFRVEADYADVLYAAPTAVEVQVDRRLRQRPDGTLLVEPMGQGTTYSVVSRREPLTEERLRQVDGGTIPDEVLEQYAQPPMTTDRVLDAATEVADGARTQYDKILALEAWMGKRVEYSLDAPLAPKGVDVVDHFLFEAEQGWCEQIASSLVVMARANGIPARLVTGFVPDERDPLTGVFTVRMRDAHAWAEVWFPEVGWVPFDPTANVSLAGNDKSEPTLTQWLFDHLVLIVLVVVGIVLVAGPLRSFIRRIRNRRADRSPPAWAAAADRRLAALGARVERPRLGHETATAYAVALAARYGDDRLLQVGRTIDDALFAPVPPSPAEQQAADHVLSALADAPDPERDPVPAG